MYTVHLRLIGKHVLDFLVVLIQLFSLPLTAEATSENRLKMGQYPPNFHVEGDVPLQSFSHG